VACRGAMNTAFSTRCTAHRLRLELVVVPRDEPTPPHLEQGIEMCHDVGESPEQSPLACSSPTTYY
jgi:hypothetical protein